MNKKQARRLRNAAVDAVNPIRYPELFVRTYNGLKVWWSKLPGGIRQYSTDQDLARQARRIARYS